MKELQEKINRAYGDFALDNEKQIAGNKAAGVRARKAAFELTKLLKEFRKVSVEFDAQK
jgi:hypothetical protein